MHMMLPYNNLNMPIQIPPGFQLVSQAGQLSDASILSNLQQQMNIQQQQNHNAEKLRSDFIRERKRPFPDPGAYSDAGSEEFNEMKKLHSDFASNALGGVGIEKPGTGPLLLKILIPAYAAGSIIGKCGQTITQLQKDSGAVIKLSKAKDFYPGTTERIGLVTGDAPALKQVFQFMTEKTYEFPVPKDMAIINGDRHKQVKIIVPNTTAGLIIGKGGATIKQIMESSGAKVQLSQKPEQINLQERVITVTGEKTELFKAGDVILAKIKEDPQSGCCPNLSYAGFAGPVANANPTGSPYADANLLTTTSAGITMVPIASTTPLMTNVQMGNTLSNSMLGSYTMVPNMQTSFQPLLSDTSQASQLSNFNVGLQQGGLPLACFAAQAAHSNPEFKADLTKKEPDDYAVDFGFDFQRKARAQLSSQNLYMFK